MHVSGFNTTRYQATDMLDSFEPTPSSNSSPGRFNTNMNSGDITDTKMGDLSNHGNEGTNRSLNPNSNSFVPRTQTLPQMEIVRQTVDNALSNIENRLMHLNKTVKGIVFTFVCYFSFFLLFLGCFFAYPCTLLAKQFCDKYDTNTEFETN